MFKQLLFILAVMTQATPAPPTMSRGGNTYAELDTLTGWVGATAYIVEGTDLISIVGNGRILELQVGSKKALIDGKPQDLAFVPIRENGVVYVPMARVTDDFGITVTIHPDGHLATVMNRKEHDSVDVLLDRLPKVSSIQILKTPSPEALKHYQIGIDYKHHAKIGEAERELRTAISLTPAYDEALLALAWVLIEDNKQADASELFKKVAKTTHFSKFKRDAMSGLAKLMPKEEPVETIVKPHRQKSQSTETQSTAPQSGQQSSMTDVEFARSAFSALAKGDQSVEDRIDWENLHFNVSYDAGAIYKTMPSEADKSGFRKAFIVNFSKSFHDKGADEDSLMNWKIEKDGISQSVVSAEMPNNSHLLLTISKKDGVQKIAAIQNSQF